MLKFLPFFIIFLTLFITQCVVIYCGFKLHKIHGLKFGERSFNIFVVFSNQFKNRYPKGKKIGGLLRKLVVFQIILVMVLIFLALAFKFSGN